MNGSSVALDGGHASAIVQEFEPRIIGFLCNWCSYAGADRAGLSQTPYPPNVNIIRVMCTGRIEPLFIMKAFEGGADGVIVLACHPGDCHYKEGNLRAAQRHALLARLLEQMGIERERCRFDYVSAGEGERYAQLITEMVESVKKRGPLSTAA
ncbi:MAG: methyl-viologen-reducing hydrogenase subunit delta [Geobacteraceae bacterium GWC2_58_44]|nr:MAG: methyl-viologen-reducing hydrogenase subunit delta [Geobacteraceae bacterium GWC2_58_44]HBG07154.1 hydrogenase iron-sulfur subunit [Geobacter sp.]